MKKQILLLCLALISLCGYAQQITVKGVVTSATDQQPLIGTTVQVKGTGTGTITGIDGDYTLPNVDKNAVLVFSSIGFESQEIAVGGRTTINVVLKEAAELLDEVVVIGYGAVKKSDLTSSIATVKGDIHDIGKNIVKVLLENYSFDVIDLGKDVPPETIVDTVLEQDIHLVGLSALMTTTVVSMEETIRQLREKAPHCLVMVGGAVLNQDYADMIGADFYGKDAMQSVHYAQRVFGTEE